MPHSTTFVTLQTAWGCGCPAPMTNKESVFNLLWPGPLGPDVLFVSQKDQQLYLSPLAISPFLFPIFSLPLLLFNLFPSQYSTFTLPFPSLSLCSFLPSSPLFLFHSSLLISPLLFSFLYLFFPHPSSFYLFSLLPSSPLPNFLSPPFFSSPPPVFASPLSISFPHVCLDCKEAQI